MQFWTAVRNAGGQAQHAGTAIFEAECCDSSIRKFESSSAIAKAFVMDVWPLAQEFMAVGGLALMLDIARASPVEK